MFEDTQSLETQHSTCNRFLHSDVLISNYDLVPLPNFCHEGGDDTITSRPSPREHHQRRRHMLRSPHIRLQQKRTGTKREEGDARTLVLIPCAANDNPKLPYPIRAWARHYAGPAPTSVAHARSSRSKRNKTPSSFSSVFLFSLFCALLFRSRSSRSHIKIPSFQLQQWYQHATTRKPSHHPTSRPQNPPLPSHLRSAARAPPQPSRKRVPKRAWRSHAPDPPAQLQHGRTHPANSPSSGWLSPSPS